MHKKMFKRRFLVSILALTLVFAMALPCFASYGSYPSDYPSVPEGLTNYALVSFNYGYSSNPSDHGLQIRLINLDRVDYIEISPSSSSSYYIRPVGFNGSYVTFSDYKLTDGEWVRIGSGAELNGTISSPDFTVIYSNKNVSFSDDKFTFFNPPPDFRESVNSGLSSVLDWIGSVISSLMSGELSGLLLLVAVPIAITLVFLAAVWIRRLIWGA